MLIVDLLNRFCEIPEAKCFHQFTHVVLYCVYQHLTEVLRDISLLEVLIPGFPKSHSLTEGFFFVGTTSSR